MKRWGFVLLVAALAVPPVYAAPAEGGAAALTRFFHEVHSYQARFTQTVYDDTHQVLQTASGEMWIERPDKFRWNYDRPDRQVIVGDGQSVWVYDPGLRQVTVRPMSEAVGDTPALILSGKGHLREHFTIKTLGTRGGVAWVDLRPKRRGAGFSDIRLGFRDGLLRRLQLKDSFGQTTDMTLSHYHENRAISPEEFRFRPPKGADVVHE